MKHTRRTSEGNHPPCAYCGTPTPPGRQASPPWNWPGKGRVTNCKSCAGIVRCGVCGEEYDGAERKRRDGEPCPDCEDAADEASEAS